MAEFKNFIDTNGKSLDEIKKAINEIVNKKIENNEPCGEIASSEEIPIVKTPEYAAQKIPPYRSQPIRNTDTSPSENNLDYSTMRPVGEPPLLDRPNPIAYPHEPMPEYMNAQDEYMLAKIREMRTLEEVTRNSYIVKACAEITMVRQGEFMADVEDDYGRRVFCAIPQPIYAGMSNSQLRTYFSWRTDVRRGVYNEIDEPYLVLYCYELFNRIGVTGAEDAFGRLVALWENCHFAPKRKNFFIRWLKDFYAFNRISAPLPFEESSDKNFNSIVEFEKGDYSDKLDFLGANSTYSINESTFLNESTYPLMNGALEAVLNALDAHFRKYDVKLSTLVCGKFKKDFSWEPFARAIVDIDRQDGFQNVQISPIERYALRRGEPVLEHYELSVCRGFVGYILKSTEAKLRRLLVFGKYLNPNIKMMESDIRNREKIEAAVNAPEFADIIPDAVEEYCRGAGIKVAPKPASKKPLKPWDEQPSVEPVVVNIDVSKLENIRKLADENARKLIVDDFTERTAEISQQPEISVEKNQPDFSTDVAESADYEDIAQQIHDDEFDESVSEYAELAPTDEENPAPDFLDDRSSLENLPDEWQILAKNLTPDNLRFLNSMLNGTEREFCRERDILPQMMTEEINGEALLAIDDVLIENGAILEDYAEEVKIMIGLLKL